MASIVFSAGQWQEAIGREQVTRRLAMGASGFSQLNGGSGSWLLRGDDVVTAFMRFERNYVKRGITGSG